MDVVDLKYGRLKIIAEDGKGCRRRAICVCDCGTTKSVRLDSLRSGTIQSCGCLNREISKMVNTKHGCYRDRLYKIWAGIKGRCFNPKNTAFKDYGGRGITLCEEWHDFKVFKEWANRSGYRDDLTIERKDVNGNYEPSNCTWASVSDQRRNTTRVPGLIFKGERKTLRQWASICGISISTLCYRLKHGWSIERALKRRSSLS